ncbi:MAG: cysteinyl-tRNA synthetase, partial [Candidatus Nealsonbacteria bacterium]|nr:cysteinyl-tRNA synthetase [Candidatus Nealsonbacteria bacterium]
LITTPAGFQPNVKNVYGQIAEFFTRHLANFQPKIDIIFANNRKEANRESVVAPLAKADYIFTGPGSPTYALDNLKDTLLLKKIGERVEAGATLSLASAAVMAFSQYCLPVYEIYKVGEPLHWERGLNFFSRFGSDLTFVSHWNNNEGGRKNDTSRCFMGRDRFARIFSLLPRRKKTVVGGIDEKTAAIFDIQKRSWTVRGKGNLHYL